MRLAAALAAAVLTSCGSAPTTCGDLLAQTFGKPRAGFMDPVSRDYDIQLEVLQGSDVSLVESKNPVVICRDCKIVSMDEPNISPKRKYVYGKLLLRTPRGPRVLHCNVRISAGPLAGVTVALTDGRLGISITGAFQALYEIPESLRVDEGGLQFEIVKFMAK